MENVRVIDRVKVVKVDITRLRVDAIVNAANNDLTDGSGVNGAIHRAAGPALLRACQALQGCETGQAKYTYGYLLKAKYIIHTVGPRWYGGKYREGDLLESCYVESLKVAIRLNCKTIAFPAISCGIYDYPVYQAAEIAIRTILTFLKKDQSIKRIFLTCYDPDIYNVYRTIYNQYRQQEYKQVTDWAKPVKKELSEKAKQTKELLTSVMKGAPEPKPEPKKKPSFGSLFQSKPTAPGDSKKDKK